MEAGTLANIMESPIIVKLPDLPGPGVKGFINYLTDNSKTPVAELLKPYTAFESGLRKVYAQQPTNDVLKDGTVNLVPVFDGNEGKLKIRARNVAQETMEEAEKYLLPLSPEQRLPHGSSAVVSSLKNFQNNFNLFSESSLSELDWSNVVAAGSAVTTSLLPVPEKWAESKRSLREYYHQHLAPASDVDLFLYGLNETQALEKIKEIERSVKDSILHETTTIRTKNAITIASQHPTRHVQIVLRLYDSVSQIITGFDVDSSCVAYDGKQVYAAPRAIAAFVTQCNTIDLSRRSPSYENRLSKYSHRGFEAHWPLMDRSRIDPTIFERSFGRTQGLARLLILEKLPKSADRETYMDQRRAERGRPAITRSYNHKAHGNIKDQEEDEVAEWVEQEEVASYHTMTVPYGERYTAARINRLLYAKDLLLNAEWNQNDDRKVYLHRHPCFFGTAEEVLQDCCGYCPEPKTDEEIEIAEEEAKTNVSGALKFLKDNPGRQEIGSFNPISDDEWTTMAYVGSTARLCQAIVDKDLDHVEDWCSQEGVDVNDRDYTGRTPLHLAVMISSLEVVKCLISNGARLIARLVDGRTALHLAASRGDVDMIKALMAKSLANEEEEEARVDAKKAARKSVATHEHSETVSEVEADDLDTEGDSIDLDGEDTEESDSMTMGSFVKIDEKALAKSNDGVLEDSLDEPDVYEIDVIAWDYGLSPLHLAILNGHTDVVKLLVSEYGADVLLAVKLMDPGTTAPRGAIMTLVLALSLPVDKGKEMIKLLLSLGATSAQGDMKHVTALHYTVANNNPDFLDLLLEHDRPAALSVLNNVGLASGWQRNITSPLATAVGKGHTDMARKLLQIGARASMPFEDWIKGYLAQNSYAERNSAEQNLVIYRQGFQQPIITAAVKASGEIISTLLAHGADPATIDCNAWRILEHPGQSRYYVGETVLDIIQRKLKLLRAYSVDDENDAPMKPEVLMDRGNYITGISSTGYEIWTASQNYINAKHTNDKEWSTYKHYMENQNKEAMGLKKTAIATLIAQLEDAKQTLVRAGGKTFSDLHPNIEAQTVHQWNHHEKRAYEPFKVATTFLVPDLDDTKKVAYTKMFDAAWEGDLETIKALTLAPWQSTSGETMKIPLAVAVQDGNGFSPFSLAVLRGHFDVAEKIVEICMAQYDDGNGKRKRWIMKPADHDSDDEDSDYESENELPIYSELVSDNYTVDNLGAVASKVKSRVMPLKMIEWECHTTRTLEPNRIEDKTPEASKLQSLLAHAVLIDDMKLLKFVLALGATQQTLLADEEDSPKCYTVPSKVFIRAIALGRTAMLAEMIRCTGVGIALNDLIKTSGVEISSKPRYYQGLSVGGKKRADWAQAPNDQIINQEEQIQPLLHAAHSGSIESVEWFMSDAPMRHYKEFAARNEKDRRIRTLNETSKGFDKTISTWLNTKRDVLLHCAILSKSTTISAASQYLSLIKHILSVNPEALEQKSSEGWTPLQVAVFEGRDDVVTYLISMGANQRHRDKEGRNMIHAMLVTPNLAPRDDPNKLRTLLACFNKKDVAEMLLERCTISPGALTPLALYMSLSRDHQVSKLEIIEILAEYSPGEDLEMINGAGDLPLHVATKLGLSSITSHFLAQSPALLHRENATGRTPLEMARDIYVASIVANAPALEDRFENSQSSYNDLVQQPLSSFLPKSNEVCKKRTYEICEDFDERNPGIKRRLVSLFEANEVAKRLVAAKKGDNRPIINGGMVDVGKKDVVSTWILSSHNYS